jgi:hypothetical protein
VRYTDAGYTPAGSNRAKTHTLDNEVHSASDKESTQPVLYHSIELATSLAKGTASHMYTNDPLDHVLYYQDADTNLQCPSESTTSAIQVRDIYNVIIHNEIMFAFFIPGSGGI